jgi:uncharacterized protein YjiS (DUF1127 family)
MNHISYAPSSIEANRHHARQGQDRAPVGVARWLDLLLTWHQRRRSRADLAGMPDVMLKDIGLSRGDADQEWEKPFWRA